MPPLPTTFDDTTNASAASIQRRQNDLREFQLRRLCGLLRLSRYSSSTVAGLREDLKTIMRLVEVLDETVDVQHSQRSRKDLRGIVEVFRKRISIATRHQRYAGSSKLVIDSKASSNRGEELRRSSVLKQTKRQRQGHIRNETDALRTCERKVDFRHPSPVDK
ncbi:hypothetical protein F5888DRAFT_394929 [Russula emetica]|nr:hypothetical protein F5888DRAFT_394929 [Russula emetica]